MLHEHASAESGAAMNEPGNNERQQHTHRIPRTPRERPRSGFLQAWPGRAGYSCDPVQAALDGTVPVFASATVALAGPSVLEESAERRGPGPRLHERVDGEGDHGTTQIQVGVASRAPRNRW